MKKIIIALCFLPTIGFAYTVENLEEISLEFNTTAGSYNIVYHLDTDELKRLPGFYFTPDRRDDAREWIFDVTKKTSELAAITQEQVNELFDWDHYEDARAQAHLLVDIISAHLLQQEKPNTLLLLYLSIFKAQY